jgi:hypothetical protein
VSGQLHASVALPPEKEPLVPIDRRLGGPQCQSGGDEEVKLKLGVIYCYGVSNKDKKYSCPWS